MKNEEKAQSKTKTVVWRLIVLGYCSVVITLYILMLSNLGEMRAYRKSIESKSSLVQPQKYEQEKVPGGRDNTN